jgi:hypothetical protein
MRRLFIILILGCLLLEDQAVAQTIRPVDDSLLAAQRGRYVADGKIIGFGLQMATRWQATDGSTRQAELSMAADLRAGKVSITTSAVDNSGQGAGSNRAAGPAVSGALQSVQVAGYGNSVGNTMDVQVSRDRIVVEPGASTASARSGGATADVGSQGIVVRVDAGQAGFAEQRLGGGNGITQRALVMTDGVSLQNNARLTVHMAPGAPAMNPTLQTLRTLSTLR